MLLFHPGYRYEFEEYKIFEHPGNFSEIFKVIPTIERFKTFKGLFLGLDITEFSGIMGNNFEVKQNKESITLKNILSGDYPDFGNNELIKFYKMPVYYEHYTFIKNKLSKIEFGFVYP